VVGNLIEEALDACFSVLDGLRLIPIPVPKGIFRRNRRNNAGGVLALELLEEPLEVVVAAEDLGWLVALVLQAGLDLVEPVAANPTVDE